MLCLVYPIKRLKVWRSLQRRHKPLEKERYSLLKKCLNLIIQKATWKKAVIFTALFAALFALINYSSVGVAGLLRITGGANILDFEFGFTQEKAYQMLTALGEEGRAFYFSKILPLDFPFPMTYAFFFAGWMALLIKHTSFKRTPTYLLLIPACAMLSDWTENMGLIAMLNNYPNLPIWAVNLASTAGIFKNVLIGTSGITVGILSIIFFVKKVQKNS